MHWQRCSRYTACINCHIAHSLGQHFKIKSLWRYVRELYLTLELIQALHAGSVISSLGRWFMIFPYEGTLLSITNNLFNSSIASIFPAINLPAFRNLSPCSKLSSQSHRKAWEWNVFLRVRNLVTILPMRMQYHGRLQKQNKYLTHLRLGDPVMTCVSSHIDELSLVGLNC